MAYEYIRPDEMVSDFNDVELGTVFLRYEENGKTILQISPLNDPDNIFELVIHRCEYVMDLIRGKGYYRVE